MVKKKVLLLLVLACVVLWPVVTLGADENAVKDLFAQAQAHLNDDNDDENEERWIAAGDIYRQIAAADVGGDDGLKAQERIIWLYTRHEKPTQAREAYEYLMANFSENENLAAALENELISAFRDSGDYDTALEMYEYLMARGADDQKMLGISSGIVKCYIGLGYDANATAEVEQMLSRYANNERLPDVVFDLAYECRSQKRWEKSREFFEYFVSNWPDNKKAMVAQRYVVKASIKLGDDAAADTQINNLIAAYANNPDIGNEVSQLAEDYAQNGNHEKAASLYGQVAQRWPQSEWAPLAQCQSARMYIEIGDYTKAAEAVEKLKKELSTSPGIVEALEDVGDKYELNYSSREAYDIYKYILQNWPTHDHAITIQMKAILSQIRLRDLDKANTELSNLLNDFASNEDLAPMVHEVVEEYRDAGYNEEGRTLFKYLLENWTQDEATNLELQVGLALQSIKLKDEENAKSAIDRLIADYNDHPNIAKGLFQIGEEYFYAEKYNEASALWELLETDYPSIKFKTRDEILYVLGVCYQRMGKYDTSIEYYQEFIQKHPNHRFMADAPYVVGMIYYRHKKDYEKALYWLDYQVKFHPKKLGQNALFNQCVIYTHNIQEYNKGIEVCGQCVRDYPEGQRLWGCLSNLALCYERIGNIEKAKETLQKAYKVSSSENLRNHVSERISRLEAGGAQ